MHGWILMIAPIGYKAQGEVMLSSGGWIGPPLFQLPLSASKAFVRPPGEADVPLED